MSSYRWPRHSHTGSSAEWESGSPFRDETPFSGSHDDIGRDDDGREMRERIDSPFQHAFEGEPPAALESGSDVMAEDAAALDGSSPDELDEEPLREEEEEDEGEGEDEWSDEEPGEELYFADEELEDGSPGQESADSDRFVIEAQRAAARCASFDDCLDDALARLRPKFGTPFKHAGGYDGHYWAKGKDPVLKGHLKDGRVVPRNMLVLRAGRSPSLALKAAVDKSREWYMDCAYFVQVANLYARSQMDPAAFDTKWKGKRFRLRYHWSDGLPTKYYFRRESKTAPWKAWYRGRWNTVSSKWNVSTILRAMPRGSRVMWTNERAPRSSSFRNENTAKVGGDRYRAFGFGTHRVLTGLQIRLLLAAVDLGEPTAPIVADASNASAAVRAFANTNVFLKEATSFRRP